MLVLPFLLAAAPIVFLYEANSGEVTVGSLWLPLLVSLAFASIVLGIFYLITRDKGKATLMTSFVLVAFFLYGYFVEGVNKVMNAILNYNTIDTRTTDLAWLGLICPYRCCGPAPVEKGDSEERAHRNREQVPDRRGGRVPGHIAGPDRVPHGDPGGQGTEDGRGQ